MRRLLLSILFLVPLFTLGQGDGNFNDLRVRGDLTVDGSLVTTFLTADSANADKTATISTFVIADATDSTLIITLPAASSNANKTIAILKEDITDNLVTIDGNASETINGSLTINLTIQWEMVTLYCDGYNWLIGI